MIPEIIHRIAHEMIFFFNVIEFLAANRTDSLINASLAFRDIPAVLGLVVLEPSSSVALKGRGWAEANQQSRHVSADLLCPSTAAPSPRGGCVDLLVWDSESCDGQQQNCTNKADKWRPISLIHHSRPWSLSSAALLNWCVCPHGDLIYQISGMFFSWE